MKFFYDTEFIEGKQKKRIFNFELPKIFDSKNTIDLISIGIISETNKEYYAISKDFNLKEVWNRYDIKNNKKEYWIRENVLKNIFYELSFKEFINSTQNVININEDEDKNKNFELFKNECFKFSYEFNYNDLKRLINKYGKTNNEIREDILFYFCNNICYDELHSADFFSQKYKNSLYIWLKDVELYSYYGAYDHVVFCWLFGKMIELPNGLPKFSYDLIQLLHYIAETKSIIVRNTNDGFSERRYFVGDYYHTTKEQMIKYIKKHKNYPKQLNEHSALYDAIWNKDLYKFLNEL